MNKYNDKTYYNLSFLNNNIQKISYKNNDAVYICIFQIIQNTSKSLVYKPYLSYLLFKYPKTSSKEHFVFPFNIVKNNQKPSVIANKLVKKTTNAAVSFEGFVSSSSNHFFFYKLENQFNPIKLIKRNQQLWWATIHEICNIKKIIHFPIDPISSSIFFKYPQLIYLKDINRKNIEIPDVTYYGGPAELIPFAASVGIRANASTMYGSFYYSKSFSGVMKNALFTSNYKERNIFSKVISNKDGKHFQGAVIRIATFLGKSRHILYRKTDPFYSFIQSYDNPNAAFKGDGQKANANKGKWAKKYDSLVISKLKLHNLSGYFNSTPSFVIKSQQQLNTLSYHLIDMKFTPPVWNPYYKNFKIK
tara:strand:+ start:25739 stop:26821 length:1083 start_codon:yes stop_codon:yes gene_type:complete